MFAIQKFSTLAYLRTDSQHVAFFLNFDHVCFLTTLASSEIHCNCFHLCVIVVLAASLAFAGELIKSNSTINKLSYYPTFST